MPAEYQHRLDAIGFNWRPHESAWEEGFSLLKAYKERDGHCKVPQSHIEKGFRLGVWANKQRRNKNALPAERRRRLDELGFVWGVVSDNWENGFSYLKSYKDREGHCRVPVDHRVNGFRLGSWARNQRANKDIISAERRRRLDELGFVWDVSSDQWENGFGYLKNYKERQGHCRVPDSYIENGFRLGQWVGVQRANKNEMSAERRQRLNELGFIWGALFDRWENGFSYLKSYKEREGHCLVAALHVENDFKLGAWVRNQRVVKDTIPIERRKRLDKLGFAWKVR